MAGVGSSRRSDVEVVLEIQALSVQTQNGRFREAFCSKHPGASAAGLFGTPIQGGRGSRTPEDAFAAARLASDVVTLNPSTPFFLLFSFFSLYLNKYIIERASWRHSLPFTPVPRCSPAECTHNLAFEAKQREDLASDTNSLNQQAGSVYLNKAKSFRREATRQALTTRATSSFPAENTGLGDAHESRSLPWLFQ